MSWRRFDGIMTFLLRHCVQWGCDDDKRVTTGAPYRLLWHTAPQSLLWRHNEPDGVSNHQPRYCLLNLLFRHRLKKTSKLRVTGLCAGESPVTGEFPAQRASNAENVSIWWRHHHDHGDGNIPDMTTLCVSVIIRNLTNSRWCILPQWEIVLVDNYRSWWQLWSDAENVSVWRIRTDYRRYVSCVLNALWRHNVGMFSELLALWEGNPWWSVDVTVLPRNVMMTSSNGNIFRVTDHLCGEFTGSPANFPHKGQWRGALMFSLICARINGWVNNREAGDLRRNRAHYDVIVMITRENRCDFSWIHCLLV